MQETNTSGLDSEHIRYDEEVFIAITEENFSNTIPEFCECIYRYSMSDTGAIDTDIAKNYIGELKKYSHNYLGHIQSYKKCIILIGAIETHIMPIFPINILMSNDIQEGYRLLEG